MVSSIEVAHREVQSAFERAVQLAESGERRAAAAFEADAWGLLLALGRALIVLFPAQQVARPRAVRYRLDGAEHVLRGERSSELWTLFGKVAFTRPIGRRLQDVRAKADLTIDRELELCSGFSLGVVTGIAHLAAQRAFASVRSTWREVYGVAPAPLAILWTVDAVGDEARPFIEGTDAPAEKSKNSKVAVVAATYTLRKTDQGMEGLVNKRIPATFESHDALFKWLGVEAEKRGYGTGRTLFVADGSDHIWRGQQKSFPLAEMCLDWYHVVERLWEAEQVFYAQGTPRRSAPRLDSETKVSASGGPRTLSPAAESSTAPSETSSEYASTVQA